MSDNTLLLSIVAFTSCHHLHQYSLHDIADHVLTEDYPQNWECPFTVPRLFWITVTGYRPFLEYSHRLQTVCKFQSYFTVRLQTVQGPFLYNVNFSISQCIISDSLYPKDFSDACQGLRRKPSSGIWAKILPRQALQTSSAVLNTSTAPLASTACSAYSPMLWEAAW